MGQKIKDAADLFAAEGEEAHEILEKLKEQAQDALGLAISEAPSKSDTLGQYRYFKEKELPLIMRLEDPGERQAVLHDIAREQNLGVKNLQSALTAAEKRAEEAAEARAAAEEHEGEDARDEALVPEAGTERHEKALALLRCPDMLLRVAQDMERLGHIGEPNNKRLAFACGVSAKAGYPIQPSTHAQSSAGKNYLWGIVLSLVPPELVIERSGLSAKALFRTDMELKGKVLYIQEVAGSEDAEFTIRVLQSDGKLVYEATEKDADGTMRNVVHEKEGPTVVVQTTTRIHLHHENETRVFPIYIDESSEQTERIVQSILQEAEEGGVGLEEREEIVRIWHDAIRLLEPAKVIVPYARRIRVPSSQVRIRRDVTRLLDVVRVISWLHQHSRTRDQRGRIIATEEDFHTALALVKEPLKRTWQALSPAEEKVMRAIKALPEETRQKGFKRSDLAVEGAQPRTVQEALTSLTSTGYLERDGRRGSQGFIYTLVRDPEGMTLGIYLDPPPDAAREGEGTRASRGRARNGDRAIESPNLQEDPEIARSRGGDSNGPPQEEAREPDEEDTVRQRPIDLAEKMIHERGEAFYFYGEVQKAKPARIKLAELGWVRKSDVTDYEVPVAPVGTAGDSGDVDRDPVTRYTGSFEIGSVEVMTATEIFQGGGRVLSKGEQIPPDWPADSREVHERLSRLAPILRTTKRNHPYFEGYSYPCEEPPDVREGYTHVEFWEKADGDKEGIWVFAVHEPSEPVDREEVEDYVWVRVKSLEKVVEHFLELPGTFDASEEAHDDGE
jgi:hypothetical protein